MFNSIFLNIVGFISIIYFHIYIYMHNNLDKQMNQTGRERER